MKSHPEFMKRFFKENDPLFASKVEQTIKLQREQDGISKGDMEYLFNITPTARKELIRLGICNFKLQGRVSNDEDYQPKVIGFLEKMVRDEL
jgi:hypothetical protein